MADCLPDSAAVTRAVRGGLQLIGDLDINGVRQCSAVGDQDAGGHLVVPAWLIRSAATCAGSAVVGQDGDLGGPGLGVDPDERAADALGGGDVDVAGAGDHVDGRQLGTVGIGAAVGQQRHRLRPRRRPTPRRRAAPLRLRWSGAVTPKSACGGLAITSESTSAVWAGTTFITTLDG